MCVNFIASIWITYLLLPFLLFFLLFVSFNFKFLFYLKYFLFLVTTNSCISIYSFLLAIILVRISIQIHRHFQKICLLKFMFIWVCMCISVCVRFVWQMHFHCIFLSSAAKFHKQKKNCIYCIVNVLLQTFIHSFCFLFAFFSVLQWFLFLRLFKFYFAGFESSKCKLIYIFFWFDDCISCLSDNGFMIFHFVFEFIITFCLWSTLVLLYTYIHTSTYDI